MPASSPSSALIIGAARGLGLAVAQEYLKRGWSVVGTMRGTKKTELHDVAGRSGGALEIEIVDVVKAETIPASMPGRAHHQVRLVLDCDDEGVLDLRDCLRRASLLARCGPSAHLTKSHLFRQRRSMCGVVGRDHGIVAGRRHFSRYCSGVMPCSVR